MKSFPLVIWDRGFFGGAVPPFPKTSETQVRLAGEKGRREKHCLSSPTLVRKWRYFVLIALVVTGHRAPPRCLGAGRWSSWVQAAFRGNYRKEKINFLWKVSSLCPQVLWQLKGVSSNLACTELGFQKCSIQFASEDDRQINEIKAFFQKGKSI